MNELNELYEEYIKLLGDELRELTVMAVNRGWMSTRVAQGEELRAKIAKAKADFNYHKKDGAVRAITFDEFVQYGRIVGANIVNDMPWSFKYMGHPVTHENDDCYLIPSKNGSARFNRGEMLLLGDNGELRPITVETFEALYGQLS